MPLTQINDSLIKLDCQRTNYISLSLTEWNTNSIPSIALGSLVEVGSSLLTASGGNIECDEGVTKWEDISNSTLIFCYAKQDLSTEISTTVPTWSDSIQGYYNGTSRCYATVYKDALGNYTKKVVIKDRHFGISYNSLTTDISGGESTILNGLDLYSYNQSTELEIAHSDTAYQDGQGTNTQYSTAFIIRKPISCYLKFHSTSYQLAGLDPQYYPYGYTYVQVYQNGGWQDIYVSPTGTMTDVCRYGISLTPGNYRLKAYANVPAGAAGTQHIGLIAYLYLAGIYGSNDFLVTKVKT